MKVRYVASISEETSEIHIDTTILFETLFNLAIANIVFGQINLANEF